MSRMADLDAAIAELRKCGEAIISVSDALRTSFSTETEQPVPPPLPTIDQVRALLAEKSGEGKTKEVKALLNKYDAGKLMRHSKGAKGDQMASRLLYGIVKPKGPADDKTGAAAGVLGKPLQKNGELPGGKGLPPFVKHDGNVGGGKGG